MDNAPAGTTTPATSNNVTTGERSNGEQVIDIDNEVWYGTESTDKASNVKERSPKIPKVPATLRNIPNSKLPRWITPTVISIGPYHYGDSNLQEGQKLKSGHAEKFIHESEQKKDDLYRKIEEKTQALKTYYNKKAISRITDNGDKQLTTIFLLDGCFLLHFINYSCREDGFNILGFTRHEMAYIKEDLFLLENQLPYKVLKLLFEDAKPSNPSMEEKIKGFVASHVPFPQPQAISVNVVNPKPYHLLHYLQAVILDKPEKQDKEDKGLGGWRPKYSRKNVQELRKVGIHFKPSPTNYLRDISFNPHFGTTGCLKLPTISMNNSTMIIFLNLIALESSHTFQNTTNDLGVISYLCFLDSLIDRWDDVKELQAAGVLRNFVGEQGDVAQFFNNVCSKLVPDPSAYKKVMQEIESHIDRHNDNKLRKWYIQCKQKYFSSPWSFIALTAAVIGLLLTGIQAYTSLFSR